MTKPRTAIRRMWARPNLMDAWGEKEAPEDGCIRILAVPDNDAARRAMIERVHLAAKATFHRDTIEYILATALAPSK